MRCVRCSVSNAEALIILTHGLCVQLELTLGSVQVLYEHVRGGLKEMLILLMWFEGVGGLEAKCLYCLCKGSKFLFT